MKEKSSVMLYSGHPSKFVKIWKIWAIAIHQIFPKMAQDDHSLFWKTSPRLTRDLMIIRYFGRLHMRLTNGKAFLVTTCVIAACKICVRLQDPLFQPKDIVSLCSILTPSGQQSMWLSCRGLMKWYPGYWQPALLFAFTVTNMATVDTAFLEV